MDAALAALCSAGDQPTQMLSWIPLQVILEMSVLSILKQDQPTTDTCRERTAKSPCFASGRQSIGTSLRLLTSIMKSNFGKQRPNIKIQQPGIKIAV
jgi:hypothetical protein